MLTHAVRAVPWRRVAVVALLVLALMHVVGRWPWTVWPLQGTAVALLAAGVGWCFDEPAADVVDVAARHLAWRTTARMTGVVALLAVWSGAVWSVRDSLFGHGFAVWVQGVAVSLIAVAWTTARRSAGRAIPGGAWGFFVVPLLTAWALLRPFDREVPVFPYAAGGEYGNWRTSAAGWAVVGALALVWLAVTLSEVRWRRGHVRPATPGTPRR